MLIKRGIAVSPGVVIGPALVLGSEGHRIPRRLVSPRAVESELERFRVAVQHVCSEVEESVQIARDRLGDKYAAIFSAHLMVLHDQVLLNEIESQIRSHNAADYSVSRVLQEYANKLEGLGSERFAERAGDIRDISKRLVHQLMGERRGDLDHLTTAVVVLSSNLTPSETAKLDRRFVMGFATEVGGHTSHTAILAGALELPAVVGMGRFLDDVTDSDLVILDGSRGLLVINPDEETLARYRSREAQFRAQQELRVSQSLLPSMTSDGVTITILGNIEFPAEAEPCHEKGAEGIGLYRTEFLYLEKNREPSEEDHYDAYCEVLKAFPGQPVVIRTLDLGADKMPGSLKRDYGESVNPALGIRSIRLSLQRIEMFKTQLRAALRAAEFGDLRIMFPLISTLLEYRQARMILQDVMEDLEELGVPFKRNVPVGMMVEIPAAAIMADEFAREVDFFSLGTNDLVQYTLAVDRADPGVENLYREGDPSILRMIRMVVEAANRHQIPVSVCGQMSSDPMFIPLLVGLGVRQISVTPHAIPELKEVIRTLTIERAEAIARRAGELELARDVENYLRGELKRICPNLMLID